jgi:hypothetical protein
LKLIDILPVALGVEGLTTLVPLIIQGIGVEEGVTVTVGVIEIEGVILTLGVILGVIETEGVMLGVIETDGVTVGVIVKLGVTLTLGVTEGTGPPQLTVALFPEVPTNVPDIV